MGCTPGDKQCTEDEFPRHVVTIPVGYWIGATEVPVEGYLRFARATNRAFPIAPPFNKAWQYEAMPIVSVTYDEATLFCRWAGGKLPSEAQWEFAARGQTREWAYPWGKKIDRTKARFAGGARSSPWEFTSPVRSFPPNSLGLYDVAGNVWEWCEDYWHGDYLGAPKDDTPWVVGGAQDHVIRGGAYNSEAPYIRVSDRAYPRNQTWDFNIGFRCVLTGDLTQHPPPALPLPPKR
jgi:formylglycine-generating enzyme required for sulfatase activity